MATMVPKWQSCECHCYHQAGVHAHLVSLFDCFHFVGSYIELQISSVAKKTMF